MDCKWHGDCSYVQAKAVNEGRSKRQTNEARWQMDLLILFVIAAATTLPPPGGKAGW
jgi:hypothetical protein